MFRKINTSQQFVFPYYTIVANDYLNNNSGKRINEMHHLVDYNIIIVAVN